MPWNRVGHRFCRFRLRWPTVILLTLASLYLVLYESIPDVDVLLEQSKCPACYGTDLCWAFLRNSTPGGRSTIRLNRQTIWERVFNSKNVYGASFDGRKLVLKKLAHDWELEVLDRMLCGMDDLVRWHGARPETVQAGNCDVGETWRRFVGLSVDSLERVGLMLEVARSVLAESDVVPDAIRCPPERFLGLLFSAGNVSEHLESSATNRAMILTAMLVNPEPLLLKIFNTFSPFFPKLVGSCGRVIVVEHAGSTLDHSLQRPLGHRLRIVAQLLRLASHMSAGANPFALDFYLTDVSYDNFAVLDGGDNEAPGSRFRVSVVDVEGVVVVDGRSHIGSTSGSHSHLGVTYGSKPGFSFSFNDLCSGGSSVNTCHNYRAICLCLLSDEPCSPMNVPIGGLLWGIPAEIDDRWRLRHTIRSCTFDPPQRCFHSCQKLVEIIEEVINHLETTTS